MRLLDYLRDYDWKTTASYSANVAPLTRKQETTFRNAVALLSKSKALNTFRGDSFTNLMMRVGCTKDDGEGEVYQKTFYFGAKSKHFVEQERTVASRNYLQTIEDVSDATFGFIFNKIARVLQGDFHKKEEFLRLNPDIAQLFTRTKNRSDFIASVQNESPEIKALVRDYYLFLLHTAGLRGVSSESILVSTSTSWNAAAKFNDINQPAKVVYYYFIPTPFERYCISSAIGSSAFSHIRRLRLPEYAADSGLFPGQREVAVRGGLLPHFMLGILRADQKEFIVNPHLLAMPRADLPSIEQTGITVDQTDFDVHIKQTNYQRYSRLENDHYEAHST
ncbi:hypothetical protein DYL59_16995 [Pseudomonas kairouanensis]|uniref:Uncharacterized protein n=1 Tax=Pseudomonas kairouanensis TaxID=2293832 RepID=A0A4Z0AMR6_9PSED|nr:hypothetical protein [Pseudomonas kairouanensis]TFY87955.1 hypothetical protein DYL59_16995 [Pseudomonas kairouanensis]